MSTFCWATARPVNTAVWLISVSAATATVTAGSGWAISGAGAASAATKISAALRIGRNNRIAVTAFSANPDRAAETGAMSNTAADPSASTTISGARLTPGSP